MRFTRKINPNSKPNTNFITKKRLREDEINFDELRSYRLDRVKKELEKNNLEACILFDCASVDGLEEVLCWCFRTDNSGPPLSISEVLKCFNYSKNDFPKADIVASTFDN